jgi:hypothetical protein
MFIRRPFFVLVFIMALLSVRAAPIDILQIAKITESVEFTGMTAPNIWTLSTPVNLMMHVPNFGKSPGEQTEIRMAYDDKYLWIFARLH